MNSVFLKLFDKSKKKTFIKYFDCEFDRDKFSRKLKYSKKLIIVGGKNYE